MSLKLTNDVKTVIQKAVALLNGTARRMFMASVVKQMDRGGQRLASVEPGWNRDVIRKGLHELQSGVVCVDAFNLRGRKRVEERLPTLEADIREIAEPKSQTDPTFRTTQLYRRLTAILRH